MDSQFGREVTRFQTKHGKAVIVRYPRFEDAHDMQSFINTVSKEDTYIIASGEQYSFDQEVDFVSGVLKEMVQSNTVYLLCFIDDELVATFSVRRNVEAKKRELHIGTLGLIVSNSHRNQGIGKQVMEIGMNEARRIIHGLRIFTLTVFATNEIAHRMYANVGFREYGRLPGGILHRGSYVDHIYMYKRVSE